MTEQEEEPCLRVFRSHLNIGRILWEFFNVFTSEEKLQAISWLKERKFVYSSTSDCTYYSVWYGSKDTAIMLNPADKDGVMYFTQKKYARDYKRCCREVLSKSGLDGKVEIKGYP